jgi:hypothetical protein
VKLAQCMRARGVTTFPDPTSGPPPSAPPTNGLAFGTPGAFLSVSETMMQSPGFKQAAAACGFPGFGRGGLFGGGKTAPAPSG